MSQIESSPSSKLNRMLNYGQTQMIYVLVKLGIPDILAKGPKNAEELASQVNAHAPSLHRLLRALTSLDILTEDDQQRFALTSVSELLRSDVPGSLLPFALSYGEPWWWNAWSNLLHSIQTGETAFDRTFGMGLFDFFGENKDAADIFNNNMTTMTSKEVEGILAAYDFSGTKVLVDVAGGQGAWMTAFLNANPGARGVIIDLPAVVGGTRERLATAGLTERCEVIDGSFFEGIPSGGDTYSLKDILHDWNDEQSIHILKNCHKAMDGSGKLLVIERIIQPGNDPSPAKLIDITMLVLTGGQERTEQEYQSLLEAAGFRLNNVQTFDGVTYIIEAMPV